MKALIAVICLFMSAPAFAGMCGNKQASSSVVAKAKANPGQYRFDDGGNISFGNGFFVRRFKFNGKANVCRANNMLYAGVRKKCVKPILNGEGNDVGCKQYKTVELKTVMVGTKQVCTDHQGDNGPCTKYSTVKVKRGPNVKVAVYKKSQMSGKNDCSGFMGYTTLTIPRCND